ncbi:putative ATP-dependent helicase IRC3 isoform X2 [Dendronephthya gigantea]|uniref:putative ATP-dependent helicase IRC3 isoform X2 n=1 Tax=Dendronephthya gigantea TaxID=151771 RepID=UPI00106DAA41|nr:putative ATP-dependent helicase IRC3 isoform X2 [Dendronephthya gigantea]
MPYPRVQPKINYMSGQFKIECQEHGRLLQHQITALHRLYEWFGGENIRNDIALVCMPTGSGKTGIIACLPYCLGCIYEVDGQPRYPFDKPILVVAPDLAIQNQLVEELTLLTPKTPFLKRRNIVPDDRNDVLPTAMKIENKDDLSDQQNLRNKELIITNAQKFVGEDWMNDFDSNLFRLLIVDEAHHYPAATWKRIVDKFRSTECPVVFFTATPFRTDGQLVLGEQNGTGIAYHLKLNDAVNGRIIRESSFHEIDAEGEPRFRNRARKTVAILDKVKELLDDKRRNFRDAPHMAIAICNNVKQAQLLLELWQSSYPNESADCYHSKMQRQRQEDVMSRLKDNQLSLVIVARKLLEGFDHPPISIAAITYKITSPARFVQFVGRAQRILRREGYIESEELLADIVTHKDYKQQRNFDNFKTEKLIAEVRGDEDDDDNDA